MRILGLDPSLTDTGWVILDTEQEDARMLVASGRWKTKAKDHLPYRYRALRESLRALIVEHGPFAMAGIEVPPPRGSMFAGLYALRIQFEEVLTELRQDYVMFMPTQVKAHIKAILKDPYANAKTDSVAAAKEVMVNFKGRLNHNVADAFHVADMTRYFVLALEGVCAREHLAPNLQNAFFGPKRRTASTKSKGLLNKEGDKELGFFLLSQERYDSLYES